jgi:regulator of sirC expression with transglutaminase-like and TPR domain
LRDLGTIHHQNGSLHVAIEYFQRYLAAVPQAEDALLVRRNLRETASKLARRN